MEGGTQDTDFAGPSVKAFVKGLEYHAVGVPDVEPAESGGFLVLLLL